MKIVNKYYKSNIDDKPNFKNNQGHSSVEHIHTIFFDVITIISIRVIANTSWQCVQILES